MDEEAFGELIRSLLARREEEAQTIIREIGGKQAYAAMAAMCTVAVNRQFDESATPAEVADFISDICETYPNAERVNRTLAEALVRSSLGEEGVLEGLDLTGIGSTGGFIATAIVDAKEYGPDEIDAFVFECVEFAREAWAELARGQGEADG